LKEIDFRRNNICGEIPLRLSKCENLEGIYLHDNKLSGPIPASLSLLPKLSGIYLFNNNFEGFKT